MTTQPLFRLATLAACALLLVNCSKAPDACFIIDKGSANTKVNEEIQFNANCSTDANSYTWNFGDGASGAGATVKHKYPNAGTYTVKLTAINSSKEATASQTVTIAP